MTVKRVALMQPHYLPYIGYFQIMSMVDEFYYFTDVQFERQSWQCRNRIRMPARRALREDGALEQGDGELWLRVPWIHVPLRTEQGKIYNIRIANYGPWRQNHLASIEAFYKKSPFFDLYWSDLEEIYFKEWHKLAELNIALLEGFFRPHLEITTPTLNELELPYDRDVDKTQRLINFCDAVGAKTFVEPGGGRRIFDVEKFKSAGLEMKFFDYKPLVYKQLWGGPFVYNMSVLDAMFCLGPELRTKLREVEVMRE